MAQQMQTGVTAAIFPHEALGVRAKLVQQTVDVNKEGSVYISRTRLERAKRQAIRDVRESGIKAGLMSPLVGMHAKGHGQWSTN